MFEVTKTDNGYTALCNDGLSIETGLVFSAIGRVPNTDKLELNKAGIQADVSGKIPTNDLFQTNIPHIYAIGDIANEWNLTPVATTEGHTLADNLFGDGKGKTVDYSNIATAVFSHPPIGTIGLSEEKAREQYHDIDTYKTAFRPMIHTLTGRDEKIMMKLVVDRKTDKVLGVHMVGRDAPEIAQGFAVALKAGATKAQFDATIGIHPTSAEEFVTMREVFKED